ncbi:MAG: DUF3604 domain-containing protein [Myxococcota bacterium]|nr:DUF3604 domain-containing protein [Myxococcota bacterium]
MKFLDRAIRLSRIAFLASFRVISPLLLVLLLAGVSAAFERTEEREACADYDPLRRPFFGDLHVHSSYSFDSYISSQRNDPWQAYSFAKGEPITLPNADGEQALTAQLRRPLDFTALTDHAELLGEMNICTRDEFSWGRYAPLCMMTRSDIIYVQFLAADWWKNLAVDRGISGERSSICNFPGSDCRESLLEFWSNLQRAAEDHYDRSATCSFTTFVAYEYSDAPGFRNLHRNVIFRNERVTKAPIGAYETGSRNVKKLWSLLDQECIKGGVGCDVLAIPHNPNLSSGWMFPDPATLEEAEARKFFEPLVELTQHKASSECRFDRIVGRGVGTADELCTFEQNETDNLSSLGVVFGEMRAPEGAPVPIDDFARRNMVRNVLKDGLTLEKKMGTNPFKLGFIGSTDTHSATPGASEEDDYLGHLGRRDAGYRNVQDHFADNPGGLAVVWAEENSRDALFEAMRRRETYATSGTRPVLRFFGGFELDADACQGEDFVAHGYAKGVPMGGDLAQPSGVGNPRFLMAALKDPGSPGRPGLDLQRIQIIKGWVGEDGASREEVIDVAGGPLGVAGVDPETCAPTGRGHGQLCSVWEDPDFDPAEPAFYYARLLENPSCRWSTLQCQAAGVNPFSDACETQADAATAAAQDTGAIGDVYGRCCLDEAEEPFYSPVIQERAWSSPIWYRPGESLPVSAN